MYIEGETILAITDHTALQLLGMYIPDTFPYQIKILYFLFWFSLL